MFCVPPSGMSSTARQRPVTDDWVPADASATRIRQPIDNSLRMSLLPNGDLARRARPDYRFFAGDRRAAFVAFRLTGAERREAAV